MNDELEKVLSELTSTVRTGLNLSKEGSEAQAAFKNLAGVLNDIRDLYRDTSPEAKELMSEVVLGTGETPYKLALKRAREAQALASRLLLSLRTEMVVGRAMRLNETTKWLENLGEEPELLTISNTPKPAELAVVSTQGMFACMAAAIIICVYLLAGGCSGPNREEAKPAVTVTVTKKLPGCTIAQKVAGEKNACR